MRRIPHPDGLIHSQLSVSCVKWLFQKSVAAFSLLALLVLGGLASTSAFAAPGTPGMPQAPITVYAEDFENVPVSRTAQRLETYSGTAPLSETYTADAVWLSGGSSCNGIVLSFNYDGSGGVACAYYSNLKTLAQKLGVLNSSAVPENNHVVAAYTNGNPGLDKVEFETLNSIPLLTTTSRYISFSVNAAAINCYASGPQYKFYLVDPGTGAETATFTTAINPCNPAPSSNIVVYGTYASNSAILFSGASLKIRMKNGNGSGSGNDAAFDDIKVLDSTPQLDKSFAPVNQTVGQTSTLTFTITNTTDMAAKSGWSFTDTLPAGLTLATPASASTTCPAGSVTAASGGSTVAISGGGLTAGMASCKVTVAVTSNVIGTYTNNASNITSSVGLNPPGSASVTFGAGSFANMRATVNLPTAALVGSTVTGSFTCTNGGTDNAIAASCSIAGLPPAATISCTPSVPVTSLPSGSAVVCNVSFVMPATPVSATATAASSTPDPDTTTNTASATVAPSSSADMRASVSLPSAVLVGNTVTGSFTCTNGGPDSAIAASCSIAGLPSGATVSCTPTVPTSAPLASGSAVVCNVSYVMPATPVSATVTASSSTPDPSTTNNTASTTVAPSISADMRASVSLPTAALVGSTVTGSFTCTNGGSSSAIAASCSRRIQPAVATP